MLTPRNVTRSSNKNKFKQENKKFYLLLITQLIILSNFIDYKKTNFFKFIFLFNFNFIILNRILTIV